MIKGLLIGCALLAHSNTYGDFIVVNNPAFDWSGFYSDGFSTQGSMEYPYSSAQEFHLDNNYVLSSLRWWGGMNNFFGTGDSNLKGFNIVVWNQDFTQQVINQTILSNQYTKTALPVTNEYGGQVSEFFMPFINPIQAGTYHMNIGAVYNTQLPLNDQWIWSAGIYAITDPSSFAITTKEVNGSNVGAVWGNWNQFDASTNPGGAFVLTAPTPGAFALLGLGGVLFNRRRRR